MTPRATLNAITGRCAGCGHRLGPAPFLVELITALLFAGLAFRASGMLRLVACCAVASAGVVLWQVDVAVRRLPDQLTIPAFAAAAVTLFAAAMVDGEPGRAIGVSTGAGGLAAGYLLLFLCCPSGIGLGDVKLALPLGALLGWHGWFPTLLGATIGFALCGVVSAGLLVAGRVGRKDALPHGPFMLLGTLVTVLTLG